MIPQTEKTILSAYLLSDTFNRATTAHLKQEFFEDDTSKQLIKLALDYTVNNQQTPNKLVLTTLLEQESGIKQATYEDCINVLNEIYADSNVQDIKTTDHTWLMETTEKWCKERSVYNAILKSIDILDGKVTEKNKVLDKAAIPELMQKALAISFDSSIGHDYIGEYQDRYDFLHSPVAKIPFAIPILNKITGGGIEKASLTTLVCPPHGGKSLTMASFAADWLRMGYNVLVITLEMAEMKIGERIDANMLNVDIDQLKSVPERTYKKKFEEFKQKGFGKLIIKEYPTSSAGSSHFRFLLQELELKQGFVPDIVVIDYMGICIPTRIRQSDNMYTNQKVVSEEIRGLAMERKFAAVSAVQTNKNGMGASDFDMSDISESSGHAMTADFMLGIITTDELVALGQARFKQLKNRFGSIHDIPSFLVNMDRKKMRVFEDKPFTADSRMNSFTPPAEQEYSFDDDAVDPDDGIVPARNRFTRQKFGDDMTV